MIDKLVHYWYGYLLVQLCGFSPERFLNLCSANAIPVWDLEYRNGCCQFYISIQGFRKTKPLVRKSKVRLRILKKFGLPFFLYRNRLRKLYFVGFTAFFLILYLMSLFIWDIEFEGNQMYTYDTLLKFFQTQQIHYGMPKYKIDCEALEAALRTEFSEITWVSAQVSGTRLLVQLKENEVLSSIPVKNTSPSDLVASKDGVIISMIVRSGVPKVAIGDSVTQGQILVSGTVPVTNDAEEIANTHLVRSDADIIAETKYRYRKDVLLLHPVTVLTGKERNGWYFKCFRYSLMLILPKKQDTTWELWMEENQLKLFENFYLPVYVGKITGKEYITYERLYTEEEKKQVAEQIHLHFLKNLLEKGVQIIKNNVTILDNGMSCTVEGDLETKESICRMQSITEPQETGESNERSRDDD